MKAFSKLSSSEKESLKVEKTTFKELSDDDVLEGLKNGNESVLGFVYGKYVHDLFRFGSQFSRDSDMVKDCIQDVFAVMVRRNLGLGKIISIKSYLYKSLYRAIVEKARKERKYLLDHPVLDNLDGFEIEISRESRMIDEEVYLSKVARVNEELKNLSKKQKQAILLYYYDGFSQEEIASLMDLKDQNSVTKLIRRGLDAIRMHISMFSFLLIKTLIYPFF
ncbi:RNA polymerase sigma factor [Reichenbachiella sp. MALMAid0571]|uniref:RNA polymerase sigma factor n=1 Tax=Reichenbachiella sp. MALMAid0571 TaxID=3143939 RepID=UPI0032DFA8C3